MENKKLNNVMAIVLGLLIFNFGANLFFKPSVIRKVTGYVLDLAGYNQPVGALLAIVGLVLLGTGVKRLKVVKKK